MVNPSTLVAVIDDDESVRESLPDLLQELGYTSRAFASAEEFLASGFIAEARCLILDIAMPGLSGPELHRELIRQGYTTPVIFITALTGKRVRTELVQHGPVAILSKPFSEHDLRAALASALPGS